MALTLSGKIVKYLLFLFNFLFVLTGIIILSVGVTVQAVYHPYSEFLVDSQFFSIPKLLIAIGSIIFIIAFFGCCGAYKENYCMTLTFSALLILIFILELAAGISGYVLRNETKDLLYRSLNGTMGQYAKENEVEVTKLWDEIQTKFECCGLTNATDWFKAGPQFNETNIPMSCCSTDVGAIGEAKCPNEKTLYPTGCVESFGNFIKAHAVSLGAAGIGLAIIQFVGVFFACYLSKQIKMQNGMTGFS